MRAHSIVVPRTARFWTIGNEPAEATSMWFALHGYGQLAKDFLPCFQPLVNDTGRIVIAPEGLSRFYTSGVSGRVGASWMTREDRAHEIDDYVGMLDRVWEVIFSDATPIDEAARTKGAAQGGLKTTADSASDGVTGVAPKIIVLGFSQGAATACRWLTSGRLRADRLVLWGGAVPPDVDLTRLKSSLGSSPLTLVVGSDDMYIDHDRLEEETVRLRTAGVALDVMRFDGGHQMDGPTLRTLAHRLD